MGYMTAWDQFYMIALNSRIEASDPLINVMLNCKIGDLEIHIFTLNLEMGALEPYIFTLNLNKWAPDLYIFSENMEMGAPEPCTSFYVKLGKWGPWAI